jgi:SEL1 protein
VGDYYLKGLGIPAGVPQPQKAAACYQSAAGTRTSALAMHNLGWMHENGIGIAKDFHLAKRYYDDALEINPEAYLPVTLSLIKLHLRSLFNSFVGGSEMQSLSIFPTGTTGEGGEMGSSSSSSGGGDGSLWQSLMRVRDEVAGRWPIGGGGGDALEGGGDGNDGGGRRYYEHEDVARQNQLAEAQRALEGDDDPVEWARAARERDRETVRGEGDEGEDQLWSEDDLLETLVLIGLCLAFGCVWSCWRKDRQTFYDRCADRSRVGDSQVAHVLSSSATGSRTG